MGTWIVIAMGQSDRPHDKLGVLSLGWAMFFNYLFILD
jgi:hypothetical protein